MWKQAACGLYLGIRQRFPGSRRSDLGRTSIQLWGFRVRPLPKLCVKKRCFKTLRVENLNMASDPE